jgi:hypothetical protein
VEDTRLITEVVDIDMADDKTKTVSVKLATDVVRLARIVASYEGEHMTTMLSDMIRPLLAKRHADAMAKEAKIDPTPKARKK